MKHVEFEKITINTIDELNSAVQMFPPFSDFNPLSLLCWNEYNDNSFAFLNGNLVIKIKDYLKDHYNISVLGINDIDNTLKELVGYTDKISFVPEITINAIHDKGKFAISEDRDNFDYVIETKALSLLKGKSYKNIRKHLKKFRNANSDFNIRELDLESKTDVKSLINLTAEWNDAKQFDERKFNEDTLSIKTFIDYSRYFRCLSVGIYAKNKLIAFTLNELLPSGWVMGHFGKSHNNYEYSSLMAEYCTSQLLNQLNYKYLNLQQDVGIMGLREAKIALHPVQFLKKYVITRLIT